MKNSLVSGAGLRCSVGHFAQALAVLAALCSGLPGQALAQAQSQSSAPASSPLSGVELPRSDLGSQDRFDPDAAKDSERARQLLRSLLADDMARVAGKGAKPPGVGAPESSATPGQAAAAVPSQATPSLANPISTLNQSAAPPGLSQVPPDKNALEAADSKNTAANGADARIGNRSNESDGASATSPNFAPTAPVDGHRTRALVASLLSEIAPYGIVALVFYLGFLALKAKLQSDARKAERSSRSGRRRRDGRQPDRSDRDPAPAMAGQAAGETTAARN